MRSAVQAHNPESFIPSLTAAGHPRTGELERIAERMLRVIGENPGRDGLVQTPERFAEALRFLTSGYGAEPKDIVGDAIFEEVSSELVFLRNVEFYSLCEHHVLPFFGKAHIAYIPNGRVVGLSKIPRIVDALARRLQIQERLTQQIAEELNRLLSPKGVAVFVEASHLCMMMRGVEKQNSTTFTKATLGAFAQDAGLRSELLLLINGR